MKVQSSTHGSTWFKFSNSRAPPKRASFSSNVQPTMDTGVEDHEETAAIPPVFNFSVGLIGFARFLSKLESLMVNP